MRDLQLFIYDDSNNQLGELDLTDSDDFALKLSKSIATITDLGRRNTSYSLDFEAPQTKNNNKLLAGLRFATHEKAILGQKACQIMVDGNQIDRGFLYPFASEFDGEYRLVFKGLNNDWVEKLRDVELNQLNWRDYKTLLRTEEATDWFDLSRFTTLNSQNSTVSDLVYPFVNRNNSGAISDLRPQLHLRSIILAMFEKIGYTVSSAWLDSDWVKAGSAGVAYTDTFSNPYTHLGLSVDPAFQMTREQLDLVAQLIHYAAYTASPPKTDPDSWTTVETAGNAGTPTVQNIRQFYRFPGVLSGVIQDANTRWNFATSEMTIGIGGTYGITYDFRFEIGAWSDYYAKYQSYNGSFSTPLPPSVNWYIVKNNTSDTAIDGTIVVSGSATGIGLGTANLAPTLGSSTNTIFQSFASGDVISFFLEVNDDAGRGNAFTFDPYLNAPSRQYWRIRMNDRSTIRIVPRADVQLGDVFRINTHIPEGIKCLSLLQDFKTMFNLYFDVDVNSKVVTIEPRDDFYNNTFEDITERVDLNTPPKLNYLTDYKNELVFKYATDSKDKYLEQWNKINDKTYAEFIHVMGNNTRFEKGQSVLSTSIISATIQGELESSVGIMSSIIKEEYLNSDNANKPVNRNYGARVFQLAKGRQYNSGSIPRRTSAPLEVLTAIMEDYGNTPTFQDRRLTFDATKGLVEQYYAKTIANIEDTAILTISMNLSLYDFMSWDMARTYYISEPAEIAGYYITDSIKNFNVTKEVPTEITLVKFKDFTPIDVPQGIGNVNVITQTNPEPKPILCTVNGAIVDCLDNNFQRMYKL